MSGGETRWRLSQPILLAAAFLILVIIAASTVFLVRRSAQQFDIVAHTLDVQNRLSQALLDLRRLESAQRGFLLTNQGVYLGEYSRLESRVMLTLNELRQKTEDNKDRGRQIDEAKKLATSKLAEMAKTIALTEAGKKEDALALVDSGEGRTYMELLQTQISGMSADEQRLLRQRLSSAKDTDFRLSGPRPSTWIRSSEPSPRA